MKKALYAVAVIATVAIAAWNYQQNKQYDGLSELAIENVEALAGGELPGCIYTVTYKWEGDFGNTFLTKVCTPDGHSCC